MKILVFGAGGMLGHKLLQVFAPDAEVWGTVRGSFSDIERFQVIEPSRCIEGIDAADAEAIKRALDRVRPDVVVNAVGVVKQLPASKNLINTLLINSIFPHRVAEHSETMGFRFITISTDCVFDGVKGNYTECDLPNASDLYGKSKNLGEVDGTNTLTLRTSIIGRELSSGHSLVEWFLSNAGGKVKGFTKAIYSGFPTVVLASIIKDLIFDQPELRGLYHVSSDPISKFELLGLLKRSYTADIEIEPSDEVRIDRSLNSARFRSETGFIPEPWDVMVEKMAADPTEYRKWK